MSKEIFFTDEFRKEIWDKFEEMEQRLKFLKSIVQNKMPLTNNGIEEQNLCNTILLTELKQINDKIIKEYKNLLLRR